MSSSPSQDHLTLPSSLSPQSSDPTLSQPSSLKSLFLFRYGLSISIAISAGVVLTSLAIATAFAIHTRVQQNFNYQQQLVFEKAKSYQQLGDFYRCSLEAEQIQPEAIIFSEAQFLLQSCKESWLAEQINQAQRLANQGEYKRAISLLSQIPSQQQNPQIQALIQQFSQRIYDIAWGYYQSPDNQFNQALTVLQAIPKASPLYDEAQTAIGQMQSEWSTNEQLILALNQSLQSNDLSNARDLTQQVSQHPFWQQQLQPFLQTLQSLEQEQLYSSIFQNAKDALLRKEPQTAINLANQLPDALPWSERKANLIAQAQAEQRQLNLCHSLFSWLIDCYSLH